MGWKDLHSRVCAKEYDVVSLFVVRVQECCWEEILSSVCWHRVTYPVLCPGENWVKAFGVSGNGLVSCFGRCLPQSLLPMAVLVVTGGDILA